jgi:hypothetical protein
MLDDRGPLAAGQTFYMTLFVAFHDATDRPASISDILFFVEYPAGSKYLAYFFFGEIGSVSPSSRL